ncbi:uncharacterized protein LOC131605592 [Vicia villosa]|uniref:uncharacterized protein LOC131605592 n=1 Tax=Vicia villosa TaxID=3911 RepID=UPI00273BEF02|nr:uncharacterized protein LOC131605592 [Vicia villosa]
MEERRNNIPASIHDPSKNGGSRFLVLEGDETDLIVGDTSINGGNSKEVIAGDKAVSIINNSVGKETYREKVSMVSSSDVADMVENNGNTQKRDLINSLTNLGLNGETLGRSINDKSIANKAGKGGKKQEKSIRSKPNGLETRGKIQMKDKSGGISKSGVEDTLVSYEPGVAKVVEQYDTFNLIRREKKGEVGERKMWKVNNVDTSGSQELGKSHANELPNIEIDIPPDSNHQLQRKEAFLYGGSSGSEMVLGNELEEDDLIVEVWNCRGAANVSFYRYCKNYVDSVKPVMMVIVETRCEPGKLSSAIRRLGFDSMEIVENNDFSGGILMAWKSNLLTVQVCKKADVLIHSNIKMNNAPEWSFTAIYARPNDISKKQLWEELQKLAIDMKKAWMVAGDFNDIMSIGDKKGGAPVTINRCQKMRDRMGSCMLSNLESKGPRFMWRGPIYHGGQRIYEKLDRAIVNDDWKLQFPDSYEKVLTRVEFSDHHPIQIELHEENHQYSKKPFCFENAWLLNDSYPSMLHETWKKDHSLLSNLNNVVAGIESWKFNTFDVVRREKKVLIRRLDGVQRKLQQYDNIGGMRRLEVQLQHELSYILNQEELMWFQRSRSMWLSDGDRNTKYYHMRTIGRRKRNKIMMLKDENGATEVGFHKLEDARIRVLEKDISVEEVHKALFSMKPWKAPGPDGFSTGFYQKAWKTVGEDMVDFVKKVWSNPSMIADVNKTDVCLIPKLEQPMSVIHFRPISLCNTIYKVISKRGVCQGDPMSPYLFVLCMDKLSHLIEDAVTKKKWKAFQVGKDGVNISHLMFADDLLIFGEASEKQVSCMMEILKKFCSMSGQDISKEKSSILFSRNVARSVRSRLMSLSGLRETGGFDKYLGVPLTRKALKMTDFSYIIDQLALKLSAWKARHFSFAGRLALTKSVMEAVPVYPMMTNLLPKACINNIQKLQRNFIWGDLDSKRKYHAVGWDKLTTAKCEGGLGLRDLNLMNQVCMMKLGSKILNGFFFFSKQDNINRRTKGSPTCLQKGGTSQKRKKIQTN